MAIVVTGSGVFAKESVNGDRPAVFAELINCRKIADQNQRLACYDAQVAAIDEAEQRADLVVVDRAQIKSAKRSLFGLSLPDLNIFGRSKEGATNPVEEIEELQAVVKSASQGRDGRWIIILEDGARWRQNETKTLVRYPKAGSSITIRRAALGSYMASIDGQRATRVKREN